MEMNPGLEFRFLTPAAAERCLRVESSMAGREPTKAELALAAERHTIIFFPNPNLCPISYNRLLDIACFLNVWEM